MRTAEDPFPMETTYAWDDDTRGSHADDAPQSGDPSGLMVVAAPAIALAMRAREHEGPRPPEDDPRAGSQEREYEPGAEAAGAV